MTTSDYNTLAVEFDTLNLSKLRIINAGENAYVGSIDPNDNRILLELFRLGINTADLAKLASHLITQQTLEWNLRQEFRSTMLESIANNTT